MVLKDIRVGEHGGFRSNGRHRAFQLGWKIVCKLGWLELFQGNTTKKVRSQTGESSGHLPQFQPKYLCFDHFSTLGFSKRSHLLMKKLKQLGQNTDWLYGQKK
jgi:hypothetical protein